MADPIKRFYKLVSTAKTSNGYEIHLDGRAVKTKDRATLIAPNEAIAQLVQAEWSAQSEHVQPDTMPVTQILSTQIDKISGERENITPALLKYVNTDYICYPADDPPDLVIRQNEHWQPWQNWISEQAGTPLLTTTRLGALEQPKAIHETIESLIRGLNDAQFTVLQIVCASAGSIILSLAFTYQKLPAQALFNAIRVEEHHKADLYNESFYGSDPAQEAKDALLLREYEACENFLALLP